MIVSLAPFLSWPVLIWILVGGFVVICVWRLSQQIAAAKKRTFIRALAISIAFMPTILPTTSEFASGIVMPAWYALFVAGRDPNAVALLAGLIPVTLGTVAAWQLGMTLYLLNRWSMKSDRVK